MKRVAKLVLRNNNDEYLLLYRGDHPSFPNDPDLPGGTVEDNEDPIHALLRELVEETGITLDATKLEKLHESDAYNSGYVYYLYTAALTNNPSVVISWEHDRYAWLSLDDFTTRIHTAVDKYMHMAYDYLSRNGSRPASGATKWPSRKRRFFRGFADWFGPATSKRSERGRWFGGAKLSQELVPRKLSG